MMLGCVCSMYSGCKDEESVKNGCKVVYNKAAKSSDIVDDKVKNDAIMMKVEDIEVSCSEVMMYILSMKKEYETMFNKNVWNYSLDSVDKDDASFESIAKENIIKQITMLKVLRNVAKDEENIDIELNNAEKVEVKDAATEYLSKLSSEDKEKYDITQDIAETYFEDNYIASKIYDYLTMDITEVTKEEARVVSLKQIEVLFNGKTKDGKSITKNDETIQKAKDKIEKIYSKLKKPNANFSKIAAKDSDISDIDVLLKKGDKEKAYENVAFDLKQDEISDIIEGDNGYYILYCVVENDVNESRKYLSQLNEKKFCDRFFEKYNEWVKEYEVYVVSDLWNKISFPDM